MNKKLVATIVMSTVLASAFAVNAGASNDKKVLKDETDSVHNVVGTLGKVTGATAEERAIKALDTVKADFGITRTSGHYKVKASSKDEKGTTHTKLQQTLNGLNVVGHEVIAHEADGLVLGVTGTTKDLKANANKPVVIRDKAIASAVAHTGFTGELLEAAAAELVYLPQGDTAALAYEVKVNYLAEQPGRWTIYVDAVDGSVLEAINQIENVTGTNATGSGTGVLGDRKSVNTTLSAGKYYLEDHTKAMFATGGVVLTKNYNNSSSMTDFIDADNTWGDSVQRAGVDAHYYAGKTYDYYYNQLGRNSYDGAGATLLSGVHYGTNYNNAFWNGKQMTYGDGDGQVFIALSGGFDVVAHELTHGVTEHTSGLVYRDQSGALNESWSDALAAVIEGSNWLIGEDVYTPGKNGDALRSMSNPNEFGDPSHMNQYVNTSSDNGGVHTNSGIPNKVFYNLATSINSRAIAGKIWYTASRDYMTSRTNFSGARAATLQAAAALYGSGSTT
jgi:Zn-dependent metalloprotease